VQAPGDRRLTVYHLPVRLRLVVVAPAGTEYTVDPIGVERLLDMVIPGLGAVAFHDKPRVRVWPAQLSHQGFAVSFHRRTPPRAPPGARRRGSRRAGGWSPAGPRRAGSRCCWAWGCGRTSPTPWAGGRWNSTSGWTCCGSRTARIDAS